MRKRVVRKAIPMADRKLRSGFERKVRKFLEEEKVKYTYESLVIKYTVPETKRSYTPDFILPNGVIVEVKGYWDAASRRKMALVVEQNPHLKIKLLFQRDNTISKKSKTKYTEWAKARGIDCAVSTSGKIPEEWLDE